MQLSDFLFIAAAAVVVANLFTIIVFKKRLYWEQCRSERVPSTSSASMCRPILARRWIDMQGECWSQWHSWQLHSSMQKLRAVCIFRLLNCSDCWLRFCTCVQSVWFWHCHHHVAERFGCCQSCIYDVQKGICRSTSMRCQHIKKKFSINVYATTYYFPEKTPLTIFSMVMRCSASSDKVTLLYTLDCNTWAACMSEDMWWACLLPVKSALSSWFLTDW